MKRKYLLIAVSVFMVGASCDLSAITASDIFGKVKTTAGAIFSPVVKPFATNVQALYGRTAADANTLMTTGSLPQPTAPTPMPVQAVSEEDQMRSHFSTLMINMRTAHSDAVTKEPLGGMESLQANTLFYQQADAARKAGETLRMHASSQCAVEKSSASHAEMKAQYATTPTAKHTAMTEQLHAIETYIALLKKEDAIIKLEIEAANYYIMACQKVVAHIGEQKVQEGHTYLANLQAREAQIAAELPAAQQTDSTIRAHLATMQPAAAYGHDVTMQHPTATGVTQSAVHYPITATTPGTAAY